MSVAAQNITLTIEATGGATITKIHSKFQTKQLEAGVKFELTIGDIQSEESV